MSTDIRPSTFSDHQSISLKLQDDRDKRGPGIWKINNSVLNEEQYILSIKNIIENTKKNGIILVQPCYGKFLC